MYTWVLLPLWTKAQFKKIHTYHGNNFKLQNTETTAKIQNYNYMRFKALHATLNKNIKDEKEHHNFHTSQA